MIDRIVLIKLKDENVSERDAVAARCHEVIAAGPGVRDVRVGVPANDQSAKSWDVSLVITFDGVDDLEPFRVDPAHRALVDDYVKPRLDCIKAWDFERTGGSDV